MKKTAVFLFLAALVSCSGDQKPAPGKTAPVYDTVFPKAWLPLYPGSSWKYLKHTGDSVTWYASGYDLHTTNYGKPREGIAETKPKYLPALEGVHFIGYTQLEGDSLQFASPGSELLREETGSAWICGGRYENACKDGFMVKRRVFSADTSITVLNKTYPHCIFVREESQAYADAPPFYNHRYDLFYAKDIGLVAKYDLSGDTVVPLLRLVRYRVNKK